MPVRWDSGGAGAVGVGDGAGGEDVSVGVGPGGLGGGQDFYAEVLGQAAGEVVGGGVAADEADGGGAVPAGAAQEVAVLLWGEGVVADAGVAVGGDVGVGGEAVGIGGDSVGEVAHGGVAAVVGDACWGLFGVLVVDGVEVDAGGIDGGGGVLVRPGGGGGSGEVGARDVGAELVDVGGGEGGVCGRGEAQSGADGVGEVGAGGIGVGVDGEVGGGEVGGGDHVDHQPIAEGELVALVEGEVGDQLGAVGDRVDGAGRCCGRSGYGCGDTNDADRLAECVGVSGAAVGAAAGGIHLEGLVVGGGYGAEGFAGMAGSGGGLQVLRCDGGVGGEVGGGGRGARRIG